MKHLYFSLHGASKKTQGPNPHFMNSRPTCSAFLKFFRVLLFFLVLGLHANSQDWGDDWGDDYYEWDSEWDDEYNDDWDDEWGDYEWTGTDDDFDGIPNTEDCTPLEPTFVSISHPNVSSLSADPGDSTTQLKTSFTVQGFVKPTITLKYVAAETYKVAKTNISGCTVNYSIESTSLPVGSHGFGILVQDAYHSAEDSVHYTVVDDQKPVLTCPAAQKLCYSSTNAYTIPSLITSDNCGIKSVSYVISGATTRSGSGGNAGEQFNEGLSTITWTVTDVNDNQSSGSTDVTINKQIAVLIPDSKALNNGVDVNTVYIGYASAASLDLTANPNGGSGTYSYKWSTGATTPSIKVSPAVTTTYTITITDGGSCTVTASKQVKVADVRCGAKVNVCHGGGTLCIDKVGVTDHLNHGDKLGRCGTGNFIVSNAQATRENSLVNNNLSVYPNPGRGQFTLQLSNNKTDRAELIITNNKGVKVEQKQVQLTAGRQMLHFDLQGQSEGLYLLQVVNEGQVRTTKIAIQR